MLWYFSEFWVWCQQRLMSSLLSDKYRDSTGGGPGLKCLVPPLPPSTSSSFTPWFSPTVSRECRWLPEKFLQPDDFESLPSHKWNVNSGGGRTTLFNFGFQTFSPSISWNWVLAGQKSSSAAGWIYAPDPGLRSADAINKPNVTLQQWQLAAVFHWEAPPATCRGNSGKSKEIWRFPRNILFLCRRNVFHAAVGRLTAYWFIVGSGVKISASGFDMNGPKFEFCMHVYFPDNLIL